MRFEGAIVREQGIVFAIVVVKRHILDNNAEATRVARSFQPAFPGLPVVLMAQNHGARRPISAGPTSLVSCPASPSAPFPGANTL